jgi:phosphatidate cytidylyltransferase
MPTVSPKKSVEGTIGGVMGAGTAMVIFGMVSGVAPDVFPYSYLFALGIILGILCQVGDLCMSALKREMAAKDSSLLIPGHGGVLDKIDGLLFCFPVAYYILSIYLEHH